MKTIIYQIKNLINGKIYIGVTRQSLQRRWSGHKQKAAKGFVTALYSALRKYGVDAFDIQPVASVLLQSDAGDVERLIIAQFRSKAPNGYNLTDGGDGVRGLVPEILARTASKNRGRKHTEEAKIRIGQAGKGREVSEATRAKIRAGHLGKTLSDEHRALLSLRKIGKKLPPRSAEHCAKISAGLVRAHARRKEK